MKTLMMACLFFSVSLLFAGCNNPPKPNEPAAPMPATGAVLGSNGLSTAERQKFYHLAEGSELYPYAWAKALISDQTQKPFLENLARFGLMADEKSADNPYGLPVGITVGERLGVGKVPMIGVNCAACHVGQLTQRGRALRVDGASNLFDITMFYTDIADSTKATIKDPEKLWAFVKRYLADKERGDDTVSAAPAGANGKAGEKRGYKFGDGTRKVLGAFSDLKTMTAKGELEKALAEKIQATLKAEIEKAEKDYGTASDPVAESEKDLRGTLEKDVNALYGKPAGAGSPLGDVQGEKKKGLLRQFLRDLKTNVALFRSYIKMFKTLAAAGADKRDTPGGFGRVDAFGSARFLFFGLANKRPNTAPVSYPFIWGMGTEAWVHYNANTNSVVERNIGQALGLGASFDPKTFATTVRLENTRDLEWLAYKITPPAWPVELFGKIDETLAARGKPLYEQNCASCHDKWETTPDGFRNFQLFSLQEIGTDKNQAENFHAPITLNGKPASFAEQNGKATDLIKKAYYKANHISPAEQKKWEGNRTPIVWRDLLATGEDAKVYPARGLAGVWATAPYLHNGSVPSLYDLLLPAAQRPAVFYVGNREYDAKKLGYTSTASAGAFKFDTAGDGNSNRGHEYGKDLSEADRYALLEYLKTLK